jgi:hypothetical protein
MNLIITTHRDRRITATFDGVDLTVTIGDIDRVEVVNVFAPPMLYATPDPPSMLRPKVVMHSIALVGATDTAYFNAHHQSDAPTDHGSATGFDAVLTAVVPNGYGVPS